MFLKISGGNRPVDPIGFGPVCSHKQLKFRDKHGFGRLVGCEIGHILYAFMS